MPRGLFFGEGRKSLNGLISKIIQIKIRNFLSGIVIGINGFDRGKISKKKVKLKMKEKKMNNENEMNK